MHPWAQLLTAAMALAWPALSCAGITLYADEDFEGATVTFDRGLASLREVSLNDKASSVVVQGSPWEVCEHDEFRGRCVVLRPGGYRSLREMNLNDRLSSARPLRTGDRPPESAYAPVPPGGEVTLFEHDDFRGRALSLRTETPDLKDLGFNDRASSLVVSGSRWEACSDSRFRGRCVVLRPGHYPALRDTGLNDRLSSLREIPPWERVQESRYAPLPGPTPGGPLRPPERWWVAEVISARAVYDLPEERCWIDQAQLESVLHGRTPPRQGAPWIEGLLSHQVGHLEVQVPGGGAAGNPAAAAALVNARRDNLQVMKRCTSIPGQSEEYWDVIYTYRGVQHRVQSLYPPGRTIPVNENGDPRG